MLSHPESWQHWVAGAAAGAAVSSLVIPFINGLFVGSIAEGLGVLFRRAWVSVLASSIFHFQVTRQISHCCHQFGAIGFCFGREVTGKKSS